MNSASLCSLAGRYENPIPPQCLAPIDFLKIPALISANGDGCVNVSMHVQGADYKLGQFLDQGT